MKTLLILSLLVLSTVSIEYVDVCGTDVRDSGTYIKLCVSDGLNVETGDATHVSFYYSSTDGNLYTSEFEKMDTIGCNDYEQLSCDYFDMVPSDMAVLHSVELYLDGGDGVQYGEVTIAYADYVASFTGLEANDCQSDKGFGDEYLQFITLDEDDICQSVRIFFGDPDDTGFQAATIVAADNGVDGDECQCDRSDYTEGKASGYCDTCYFVCNTDETCDIVSDNCGTNLKYNDNYMKICTSWNYMADSENDFTVRWNYDTATDVDLETEFVEGDNMLCDDFVLGKCDYFDDVPTDAVTINYMDIEKRGEDGWQFALIDIYSQGTLIAGYGGYGEANECITYQEEKYYGNNDGSMVWVDYDDICDTVRIHFNDGIATSIYAITDCNCDLTGVWTVGMESGDLESCAAICDTEDFDNYWGNGNDVCDEVTIYSDCNYEGDSLVVTADADCLTWQPQSICVPEGVEVTIFDLCWYAGDSTLFTANESCMSENGLFLLESQANKKQTSDMHAHVTVKQV